MRQLVSNHRYWIFITIGAACLIVVIAVSSSFISGPPSAESSSSQLDSNQTATPMGKPSPIPATAVRTRTTVQTALAPTLTPTPVITQHTVLAFETLGEIAAHYRVTLDALVQGNQIEDANKISEGQILTIPLGLDLPIASTVVTTPAARVTASPMTAPLSPTHSISVVTQPANQRRFAILEGSLSTAYPLESWVDGIRIHYQPDSFVADNLEQTIRDVVDARAQVLKVLNVKFDDTIDVYFANTFFEPPNQALRGRTFALLGRVFVLFDGSGTPAERVYMLAHEFTHLVAWRSFGRPGSAMISEGLAVYAGQSFLSTEGFISLSEFCLIYRREKQLPFISSRSTTYLGHLYSLDTYYAAGCFIQFLVDSYGIQTVAKVYSNSAFEKVYGKSLKVLEGEWISMLDGETRILPINSDLLPSTYALLLADYRVLLNTAESVAINKVRYRQLDERRIALLKGLF